jgi:hypothetical protein
MANERLARESIWAILRDITLLDIGVLGDVADVAALLRRGRISRF